MNTHYLEIMMVIPHTMQNAGSYLIKYSAHIAEAKVLIFKTKRLPIYQLQQSRLQRWSNGA